MGLMQDPNQPPNYGRLKTLAGGAIVSTSSRIQGCQLAQPPLPTATGLRSAAISGRPARVRSRQFPPAVYNQPPPRPIFAATAFAWPAITCPGLSGWPPYQQPPFTASHRRPTCSAALVWIAVFLAIRLPIRLAGHLRATAGTVHHRRCAPARRRRPSIIGYVAPRVLLLLPYAGAYFCSSTNAVQCRTW